MKILICDDDRDVVIQIQKYCNSYLKKENLLETTELICAGDGSNIEALEPDILFLDIEMPLRDGLSVKEEMCKSAGKPLIIFVTSHSEAMPEAFGCNVISFLTKPVTRFHIETSLETAIRLLPRDIPLQLEHHGMISSFEVAYITVDRVYTNLYLISGEIISNQRRSLSAWENMLSEIGFLRISDNCLVNCRYIEDFGTSSITLESDMGVLNVSRRRKKNCQIAYDAYCERMARLL